MTGCHRGFFIAHSAPYLICTVLGDSHRGVELARKRRTRHTSTYREPRDAYAVTSRNPVFPSLFRLRPSAIPSRSGRSLLDIEDRRTFHPDRLAPSRTPRQVARLLMIVPKAGRSTRLSREVYSFKIPKTTAVCVRREIRKQVIHAKGRAGTKVRRPRRNAFSSISCRRK